MKLTPEEILKVKTKGTLTIIKDSPLHKGVISAMVYYAKQEVKLHAIPVVSNNEVAVCEYCKKPVPLAHASCLEKEMNKIIDEAS